MKKRLSIALFVGHMESKFSEEIFLGAAHEAENLDINLVVFPVRFLEEEHTNDFLSKKYHYQHNCMFSYAENKSFDGIIIETAVMGRYVTPDALSEILKRFSDTPVMTISEKIENYPCVSFDTNGIDLEIDHLITKHGRKRIGFVSGPSINLEAVQRFEKYKSALERHGIPYDPKLVAEGDFTAECNYVIDKLLEDNKGNIDAICFANDLMAIAGYKEINNHGLEIGKDIMVTGFDDIPEALSLNPPLTTVRARYRDLGMNAVNAMYSVLNGSDPTDITVETSLIERDSCGCKSPVTADREYLEQLTLSDPDISAFMDKIHDIVFAYYNNTNLQPNQRHINRLLRFASLLLMQVRDADSPLDRNLLLFNFTVLLNYNILNSISIESLNFILTMLCEKAVSIAPYEEKKESVYRLFMDFFKEIISIKNEHGNQYSLNIKANVRYANSIIGNMIDSFQSNKKTQLNVMQSLRAMNIRTSYLYLHEEPVISKSRYDWVQPPHELLISYHIGDKFHSFSKGRKIRAKFLFKNEFMPETRFTFIASPVFCSEENYGLLLFDIDTDDYNFYNSIITSQLSYAVKLKNMLEAQRTVQSNLRESLSQVRSNNIMLNQISKSDELTGIYNRRGFMENVVDIIKKNCGKRAAVIYADMDNLKQINDIFGHDEGDYAIKKSADILNACMRANDITARFGGDEFAAFALTHEKDFSKILLDRIEAACAHVNETNDKPYNIHISVGIHEFICNPEEDLTRIMNEADRFLYEHKKLKNVNVLKNPDDIHKFKR